ncbi:MAG: glycosyltransferase family 4 protein [Polyangia bacterium]
MAITPVMRVAYVHPFTQQLSGPDESLLALLAPLSRLNVRAHLVVPRATPLANRYRALGVTLHQQPLTILHRGMKPGETALFGPRLVMRAARLARLLRDIDADLVHTNMEVVLEGALAARMVGLPHVLHYRGNSLDSPRLLFDVLTLVWASLSDRVFCISDATAQIFRVRKRDRNVAVLYNPIPVRAFAETVRSEAVRASLGAAPDQPLVITMGRIHPRKDIETFVRACGLVAAAMPQARFAVVGTAETPVELTYHAQVLKLVDQLGVGGRLLFVGARSDVAAVMKAADVFVLASRHEGFGRVVAEAMAAGTAVVATREGALPELIDEPRFGLGAVPDDAGDFARQILSLLGDDQLRLATGRAAADRARDFDAATLAQRVRECYDELLDGRGETRRNAPIQ